MFTDTENEKTLLPHLRSRLRVHESASRLAGSAGSVGDGEWKGASSMSWMKSGRLRQTAVRRSRRIKIIRSPNYDPPESEGAM